MLIENTQNLMDRQLLNVANGFYFAAAALGLPSLPGFLYFGWAAIRMRTPAAATAPAHSGSSDALRLIEGAVQIFTAPFRLLGAASQWLTTVLAVVFLAVLVLAIVLFLTGRGLQADAGWARIMAGVFSAGFLLFSLAAMLALGGILRTPAALLAASSGYSIWVLMRTIR